MSEGAGRLLIFAVAEERVALRLRDVAEVLDPLPDMFPIPKAPRYLPGVINFHGKLVPILDLSLFAGKGEAPRNGKVVVLHKRGASLGMLVDANVTVIPEEAVIEERDGEGLAERFLVTADLTLPLLSLEELLTRLEESINDEGRM